MTDDAFTTDERTLLDRWQVPEPPVDFAARVLRPKRRARYSVGAVAAAAIVLVAGLALARGAGDAAGSILTLDRTTVHIGDRAVVVAEANTALAYTVTGDWLGKPRGVADVEQSQGSAFYRVEKAGRFVVNTPHGSIEVTGTCFTVDVGAHAATVSVHEGQVRTRPLGSDAFESVQAGESVALMRNGIETESLTASVAQVVDHYSVPRQETPQAADASLMVEAERLRADVRALQRRLATKNREERTYNLDHDALVALAEKCELVWDTPPAQIGSSPTLSDDDARALGVTADERAAIDEAMHEANARMIAVLQTTYTAVTGDDDINGVSATALLSEIEDKASTLEMQRIYQRIALERAGLPSLGPKAVGREAHIEELYRTYVEMGDALEAAIAARVGSDVASRVRDLRDGFPSRRHSSFGCP